MPTFLFTRAQGTRAFEDTDMLQPMKYPGAGFSHGTRRSQIQTAIVGVVLLVVLAGAPIAQALWKH